MELYDSIYDSLKKDLEDNVNFDSYYIEHGPILSFLKYLEQFQPEKLRELEEKGAYLDQVCSGWALDNDLELGKLWVGNKKVGVVITKPLEEELDNEEYCACENPYASATITYNTEHIWIFSSKEQEGKISPLLYSFKKESFTEDIAHLYKLKIFPEDKLNFCIDLAHFMIKHMP